MSKSLSITLPNAVADTLSRHMASLDSQLPSGVHSSKSNYIANCLKAALEKDGLIILSNEGEPYRYLEPVSNTVRCNELPIVINPNPPL